MGYTGNNGAWLMENLYYGTDNNWRHKNSDFSALVGMYDGVFNFYNTASGTEGATATLQNRLKIDSSGNVGIGDSSPAAKLEIKQGSSNWYEGIRINRSDNATQFGTFSNNSGATFIGAADTTGGSNNAILFGNSTNGTTYSEAMRIDSSGNLLVGTTSSTNTGKLRIQSATASGGDSVALTLHQANFSNGGATLIKIGTEANNFAKGAIGFKRTDSYDRGSIIFCQENSADSSNVSSSNEVARINSSGNVGIGTNNPTGSLHLTAVDSGGADVYYVAQNTVSNRIAGYKILDESGNNKVNLNYDNGSNRGTLSMGDADGEIIYVYDGSSIKSGFGIDLSGSSRELSIFHTSSGTDGNIALGKRLESNGTFSASVQITPAGTAGTANLIVNNVNSNAFNHVQENKVPNLTAGEDIFLGIGKATSTKNMGYLGYEWNASGSDNNYIHLSHCGADGLLRVYGNGNYSFAGSNVSDRDLKENIISVSDTALDKITQLEVRKFNFIKDYEVSSDGAEVETPRTQVGFIAQEVEAIIPDITVGTDGQKDMGVDTVGLVAYLTIAIQELKTELDAAKARITELEG